MDADRKRQFKNDVYAAFGRVGRALAHGNRLELLDLLAQAERGVDELAAQVGMSVANTSRHLQILRQANLVKTRRDGVRIYYRPANRAAIELSRALTRYAEASLPEVDELVRSYLGDRDELEAIDSAELIERMDAGEVELLDVREPREFDSAHLRGARSIPIGELQDRIAELPHDREIIAYCRGRYCLYADEAVRLLRDEGHRARRLEVGVSDWLRAGLAVEQGSDLGA